MGLEDGFLDRGAAGGVVDEEGGGGFFGDDAAECGVRPLRAGKTVGVEAALPFNNFVLDGLKALLDFGEVDVLAPCLFALAGGLLVLMGSLDYGRHG